MSEYIEFEVNEHDEDNVIELVYNILLAADGREIYQSAEQCEEGSPLAQALAIIPGIKHLMIDASTLTITRDDDTEWYAIIEDIRAAIVDFFL